MIDEDLPEYAKVRLGKNTFELDTKSLISSMALQLIDSSPITNNNENFDVIFDTTKNEIKDYLNDKFKEEDFFIDLFDDWKHNFRGYQSKKHLPFCKDVVVEFSDQSQWSFRMIDMMAFKNSSPDDDEFDVDYSDPVLQDDDSLISWMNEDINWEDIMHLAEEIQRPQPEPDYNSEWKACKKFVKSWDKDFNILEMLGITDKIGSEDDEEDD